MRSISMALLSLCLLLACGAAQAQIPIPDGFPDASTTGITGVGLTVNDLTPTSGRTITVDGTVVDMEDITGRIVIQADNVTIRRCRITGGGAYNIEVDGPYVGTVIEDCLLLGGGAVNVTGSNYTIRRCDISGSNDGLKVNTGCLIEDNYIHDQLKEVGTHNDGIQDSGSLSVSSGWVIRHNTILGPYLASTSAIMVSTVSGYIDDILIEENFLSGGGFTLYCTDHGDGYGTPTNATIRNNVFEADSYNNSYITFSGSPDFKGNILHTGDPIAQNPPTNLPPIADAGYNVIVTDTDADGVESITLVPDCHDNDGTIVGYAWSEDLVSLSTVQAPTLTFAVGSHSVDLTITDDDGAADTDSALILVLPASGNQAPVADAGPNQTITDLDDDGSESITLDASNSHDADGSITGYSWEEGSAALATTATATVTMAVGVHDVYLTVTDDDTATDIDTVVIIIDALCLENTYAVYAHTLDRVVRSGGNTPRPANEIEFRVGGGSTGIDGAAVIPFKLPTLHADETIISASLEVDLALIKSGVNFNVDLYGLGYRADPAVSTDDFYQGAYDGDTTDATALQDDFATPTTTIGFVTSDADAAIAAWLNAQYDAGAVGGDIVFLRLSPDTTDAGDYKYYKFRSADGSDSTPLLILQTAANNEPPIADAGSDQEVNDADDSGGEQITLNGSGSSDSDGTIVSYVWKEGANQIATGVSPQVTLSVAVHTIDLTVTDDDSATDSDSVQVTVTEYVNLPPTADAGSDQEVTDTDDNGSENVTLDGSGSYDTDGTIVSYEWKEGATPIATGVSPVVTLSVAVHTIDLTVTDDDTATDGDSVVVTVDPAPATGAKLNVGVAEDIDSSWTTVTLPQSYTSMVVVCVPNYDDSSAPAVVRIRNASGNSFDVRVDAAGGATPAVMDVHYMVVEEGVYTQAADGVTMEAVKFTSTVTNRKGSWNGQTRTYANAYTTPVVVGQVMTYNDADFSVFWCCDGAAGNPPDSGGLELGKHVGEDTDTTRADETIGYIVIEAGSGTMNGVDYVAGLSGDSIQGVGNSPPYSHSLSGLTAPMAAVVSQAGMDGGDGGWAILYGADPVTSASLKLACDEDQANDSERSHTTEQVGYIVFE